MKATLTVSSRGVVTLPVKLYTEKRIREFDAAEAELHKTLRSRTRAR